MKITKLILKNFKRLYLSNINYIEYEPKNYIELILGQNGSGKSSLVFSLTPLPADLTREYDEDGYKEIFIEHNNSVFKLGSYKKGNNHSFIKDGKELNDGNTRKVQLVLVKEYFNITPDIHEVMTGIKNFTTMSVNERKNWLTNIADVDYNYSISVFNKLKSRHRDISGALKILNTRLVNIEKNELSENDIKILKKEHDTVNEIIGDLLESKTDVSIHKDIGLESVLDSLNDDLMKVLKNSNQKVNYDKIKNDIIKYNGQIDINKKDIEKLILELKNIINKEKINNSDEKPFINKIESLTKTRDTILKNQYLKFNNIRDVNVLFNNIYSDLLDVIVKSLEYVDIDASVEKNILVNNDISKLTTLLNNEDIKFNKLLIIKNTLESNKDNSSITCNQCGNTWIDKYDDKTYKLTLTKIDNSIEKLDKLKNELSCKKEIMDLMFKKKELINEVTKYLNNDLLHPILEYITITRNLKIGYDVSIIKDVLFALLNDIKKWDTVNDLNFELNKLKTSVDIIRSSRIALMNVEVINKERVESTIHDKYLENKELSIIINKNEKDILNINKIREIRSKIQNTLLQIKNNTELDYENIRNNSINELIKIFRLKTSDIEILIKDSEFTNNTIKDVKQEILDLENKKRVLTLLIKELSPSEGLIAKSIMNFLNNFTNDMNELINSIWTYDMQVLPCTIDNGSDLNYKFPLMINNNEEDAIIDVSKSSSGMQEIINLSFKIISMYRLGIDDYALILDEYGKSLSIDHKVKAFNIHNTLVNFNFDQIFIISHFENQISLLTNENPGITILGDEMVYTNNVDKYNDNVIIK